MRSEDYDTDTGDRLLEHYAAMYSESHGVALPIARAVVDISPSLQGLLGRDDSRFSYVKALRLARLELTEDERVLLQEADDDFDRRMAIPDGR